MRLAAGMGELARHVFGSEGAAYVRRYLEANRDYDSRRGGRHLGGLLLAHHQIERGVTWAPIPSCARYDYVSRFEFGGVFEGSGLSYRAMIEPWLRTLLAGSASVVLAENVLGRRSDHYFRAHRGEQVMFCGERPYEFFGASDAERALRVLGGDIRWRPDLAVLTTAEGLAPSGDLSVEQLETLAANAVAFIVGGWDETGVVCWEPAPNS